VEARTCALALGKGTDSISEVEAPIGQILLLYMRGDLENDDQ
jgi:hypothetical protein